MSSRYVDDTSRASSSSSNGVEEAVLIFAVHWSFAQELATLFSTDKGKLREYKEQLLVAENRVRA